MPMTKAGSGAPGVPGGSGSSLIVRGDPATLARNCSRLKFEAEESTSTYFLFFVREIHAAVFGWRLFWEGVRGGLKDFLFARWGALNGLPLQSWSLSRGELRRDTVFTVYTPHVLEHAAALPRWL
jgi:hypothetical protein